MTLRIVDDVQITGAVQVTGALSLGAASLTEAALTAATRIPRSLLAQNDNAKYALPLHALRVWDDLTTSLPGAAANDDLALIEGTWGTDAPTIQSGDAKATTVTRRARVQLQLPPEYVAGQTVALRIRAGMETTISDGSATVDVECYKPDRDGAVGSDLCTNAAQSINSLTKADKDFQISASGLAAGDILDVRITIAITDTATGTAVIGEISAIELLLDIQG